MADITTAYLKMLVPQETTRSGLSRLQDYSEEDLQAIVAQGRPADPVARPVQFANPFVEGAEDLPMPEVEQIAPGAYKPNEEYLRQSRQIMDSAYMSAGQKSRALSALHSVASGEPMPLPKSQDIAKRQQQYDVASARLRAKQGYSEAKREQALAEKALERGQEMSIKEGWTAEQNANWVAQVQQRYPKAATVPALMDMEEIYAEGSDPTVLKANLQENLEMFQASDYTDAELEGKIFRQLVDLDGVSAAASWQNNVRKNRSEELKLKNETEASIRQARLDKEKLYREEAHLIMENHSQLFDAAMRTGGADVDTPAEVFKLRNMVNEARDKELARIRLEIFGEEGQRLGAGEIPTADADAEPAIGVEGEPIDQATLRTRFQSGRIKGGDDVLLDNGWWYRVNDDGTADPVRPATR